LQQLARFGIPPEMLEAVGVRSVNDTDARELLGQNGYCGADLSGILFPYRSPKTRERNGARIRLDTPLPDGGKYIMEQGCRHLFFPSDVAAYLSDLSVPVVIVEAEKSAIALRALAIRTDRLMLPIAIGGCWGWKRKIGNRPLPDGGSELQTGPSPDFDLVSWAGRDVILSFDSNAAINPKVQRARHALASELSTRGARVQIATVPAIEGVNGPDDLIATSGDPAMLDVLDGAQPLKLETRSGGFHLTPLRDLMQEPEEEISWLLADKLPAGGLSVLCAKPKVGKSTFARCLAVAVARGEPFLDSQTTKGSVIYLALEEKRDEVRRHFADLGATDEDIDIHAASAPQEAVLELCRVTRQKRPVLVVIDPLFKFIRVRDEKAYVEVCNAIEPLLTLARESGAHVLLSHHSGKMERADATDSILGSTAIFGGVDTAIVLKKGDRYRTVQSCQRYGTDWPELVLNFDPAERSLSLGVERSEAEAGRIGEAIVAYLSSRSEPQTRVQIERHVAGKTTHKRAAMKSLCTAGRVSEAGTGAKGDPLRYALNSNTYKQAGNEPEPFVDSCSHIHAGTREQQYQNGARPGVNSGDILVPGVSREGREQADSGEQAYLRGML
jgi:hypothetical protein